MKKLQLKQIIKEEIEKTIPSDVKNLVKVQKTSTSLSSAAKRINSIQKDTFNRIDKAESDVMVKVDTAVKDVNDQLTQTNKN